MCQELYILYCMLFFSLNSKSSTMSWGPFISPLRKWGVWSLQMQSPSLMGLASSRPRFNTWFFCFQNSYSWRGGNFARPRYIKINAYFPPVEAHCTLMIIDTYKFIIHVVNMGIQKSIEYNGRLVRPFNLNGRKYIKTASRKRWFWTWTQKMWWWARGKREMSIPGKEMNINKDAQVWILWSI